MNKKVYFAGSIRGGRTDASLYKEIIDYIKKTDIVLTEHIGNLSISSLEGDGRNDNLIYKQDTDWLKSSDLVIAECTNASIGVGYELAYAEKHNIKCYCFYNETKTNLSAMIKGDSFFNVYPYKDKEEMFKMIDKILERNN